MSVFEALRHAAWGNDCRINIEWVDAEALGKSKSAKVLEKLDGIVVPGGFGNRGIEGMIVAAKYALDHKIPYLGLCLGLQIMIIASARRAGLRDANSGEFDRGSKHLVVDTMNGQQGLENTGGTMRLGDYNCHLEKNSLAARAYRKSAIVERHRHRYEANGTYQDQYKSWGIKASGINPDNNLVEMIEADPETGHPFILASQFHPEFKSRPTRPHPMFDSFVKSLLPHKSGTLSKLSLQSRKK
jgi:CTP synthase